MIKTKSWLPIFSGFYNTIWDNSENNSEWEYLSEQGLTKDELDELYMLKCYSEGVREYEKQVCQAITSEVCSDLIKLGILKSYEFEKMVSPQYYNYSNDSINITYKLTKKNVKAIKDYINNHAEAWAKFLKDNYTSYSGFISHYDNFPDSEEWSIDSIINGEHQLGKVYEFILETENGDDLEWSYFDHIQGNVYESYGTVEDIRKELTERGFYEDKPEILSEIQKQKELQELRENNLQFQFKAVQ